MIGGTDIVLVGPSHLSIPDLILRICRDHWPDCLYQDADSSDVRRLDDTWVWRYGTRSKEFFIYRDPHSATVWTEYGSDPTSPNRMLHFLLRSDPGGKGGVTEVTLVCDHLDSEIRSIKESMESAFLCEMSGVDRERAA